MLAWLAGQAGLARRSETRRRRKNKFAKQTGLLVSAEVPHYNVSILHTVRQIHTSTHFAAISLRGYLTSRQSRTSVAYSVSLCFRTREIAPTFPAQRRTSCDRCEAETSFELARRRKGRNWLTVSVASSKRAIEGKLRKESCCYYRKTTCNT